MGSRETLLIEALVVDYKKTNERKKIRKREREKERAKCIPYAHTHAYTHILFLE